MTHGAEHQIEHAEHAAHASHDEFNKRVTLSIAVIAALLACVTMIGHRAHNDVLRLQNESGQKMVDASNTWARYQAVNVRSHLYQSFLETSDFATVRPEAQARLDQSRKRWQDQVDKYEKKQLPELKHEAEEQTEKSKHAAHESAEMHGRADRFDLGELFLQLGVVVCSLAILTKLRPFWYGGILCALVGAALAVTGYLGLFMAHH